MLRAGKKSVRLLPASGQPRLLSAAVLDPVPGSDQEDKSVVSSVC